ncbi:MAG: MFS transporter [Burkholderiales bacterium]|nr:MFS transporter [Burkholderiales bacterium]
MQTKTPSAEARERRFVLAFTFGNFVIGTGVMLAPGLLLVLSQDLGTALPQTALLITVAAVAMCVGSPLLATVTSRIDRRSVLAGSLVLYALGHAACALAPSLPILIAVRTLTLLGAAVFTPQAAATLGMVIAPERRAAAITAIFLGWSIASVVGSPMAAWLGAHIGWRQTFALFAVLCVVAVGWVLRVVPAGLHGTSLSRDAWRQVAAHPALLAILLVTAASASGQFITFAYIAPFVAHTLDASPNTLSFALLLFGLAGVVGNVWATRRIGAAGATSNVTLSLASMVAGMLILAVVGQWWIGFVVGALAWGGGVFANNSSQQARLVAAAPALAGASIALNTSMIYLGQAVGTTIGGAVIATRSFTWLPVTGAVVLLGALALSARASQRSVE